MKKIKKILSLLLVVGVVFSQFAGSASISRAEDGRGGVLINFGSPQIYKNEEKGSYYLSFPNLEINASEEEKAKMQPIIKISDNSDIVFRLTKNGIEDWKPIWSAYFYEGKKNIGGLYRKDLTTNTDIDTALRSIVYRVPLEDLKDFKIEIILDSNMSNLNDVRGVTGDARTTVKGGRKHPELAVVFVREAEDGFHFYGQISVADAPLKHTQGFIHWQEAYNAAKKLRLFGLKGYLATLTSEEEQRIDVGGWLGGTALYDPSAMSEDNPNGEIRDVDSIQLTPKLYSRDFIQDTKNGTEPRFENPPFKTYWYWADGPEAGTKFWQNQTISQLRKTPRTDFWDKDLVLEKEVRVGAGYIPLDDITLPNGTIYPKGVALTETTIFPIGTIMHKKGELRYNDVNTNILNKFLEENNIVLERLGEAVEGQYNNFVSTAPKNKIDIWGENSLMKYGKDGLWADWPQHSGHGQGYAVEFSNYDRGLDSTWSQENIKKDRWAVEQLNNPVSLSSEYVANNTATLKASNLVADKKYMLVDKEGKIVSIQSASAEGTLTFVDLIPNEEYRVYRLGNSEQESYTVDTSLEIQEAVEFTNDTFVNIVNTWLTTGQKYRSAKEPEIIEGIDQGSNENSGNDGNNGNNGNNENPENDGNPGNNEGETTNPVVTPVVTPIVPIEENEIPQGTKIYRRDENNPTELIEINSNEIPQGLIPTKQKDQNGEEIIILENPVALAGIEKKTTLPKTSGIPQEVFLGFGFLTLGVGLFLKRKK